ncbi:putative F-box/kelch-repeat protein [Raphanus sativus]|uniref:F-box protein At3g20705 n=1 Tax=Raphanus sativus TaxID=3726 RepID=A0A9W3CQ82_RAPSA|nr:putative F-box protein At3g20705 [Raphanus sativus]KAJ4871278.1 putative F-box/kelch-repeat protein [Raphanus sativus]
MRMTNLPRDLVEKILSRVPVKTIPAVRSTCKNWNLISKDERFANKHIENAATAAAREKEFLMITTGDTMVYLVRFNLYETCNKNFDVSINRTCISIPREHLQFSDETLVRSQVLVSSGLLICVWRNIKSKLLVWNPYWGKPRWIDCPTMYCSYERFAFGYDTSCGRHKILRFSSDKPNRHVEIYDLSFDSWRTVDAPSRRNIIEYIVPGLSLKGNTYWYARDSESRYGLSCFDFTRERFGPHLPLPPCSYSNYYAVSLSSVKEEKLAVLFASMYPSLGLDIWVTNKIEPYEVSWSKFFRVEARQHIDHCVKSGHFFIDEEKKVVVVFDRHNNAWVISGESGHFRKVDLRQYSEAFDLVGCYVPSSVQT